jgi:tRNA-binding protein
MTVRTHTGAAQRLPGVLAHVPVIPGDPQEARWGHDLPVGRAVEDIAHTSDDRDVATIDDFQKIEMRVGRVVAVEDFPEARNPSYRLTIDFGAHGVRRSSAAVRRWYERSDLVGRLVVCVTNFPPRRIATFESEVLTLGAIEADGRVVLLEPDADAELGSPIG